MTVEITPEVQQLIHCIVAGGQFSNEADVVSAAVRLLHQRQELRIKLEQGCRELDGGQRIDADEVFANLRQRAAELDGRTP